MCYVCANTSSTLRRVSGDNEEKSHQCGFTILSYSSQMPALFSCGFLTDVLLQFLYYYAELGHLGGSLSHIYNLLLGTTQLVLENPYLLGQDLKKDVCLNFSTFFNTVKLVIKTRIFSGKVTHFIMCYCCKPFSPMQLLANLQKEKF